MGDWSMSMTLSIFSSPAILSQSPAISRVPFNAFANPLYNVSMTKDDLPPPDTPVTQVNVPNGNLTLMFFKL